MSVSVHLETLSEAEKVFADLPCTIDQAVDLLLEHVARHKTLPFDQSEREIREENLRLAYGEVDFLDARPNDGLFELGEGEETPG